VKAFRGSAAAFGLMDLIVSMAAVGFVFGIVFLLFSYGVGGYALLDARQGVQGDALKARTQLERDFSLSHFDSVGVVQGNFEGFERDIVCCLGLSDWNDPARFSDNGLPLWDRYIVYYATADQGSGSLMRAELAPEVPEGLECLRITPLPAGLLGAVGLDVPPADLALIGRQKVTDDLQEFSCSTDPSLQVVSVRLAGRRVSGARPGGAKRTDEGFEAVFELDPLNTSPKL
jgi:hypothetical protein